ncbi:hypothetical protein [Inquilinus sp. Marseille-Q2685]|uniref:hypothetical protein n=1 Tax=Inquilinus sp. Marseille-Q2685 TaxID=2866581 RepID=UPI001CE470E3|nr:hypothetical protein [Inquilinus sp. Marseille-Q2685]
MRLLFAALAAGMIATAALPAPAETTPVLCPEADGMMRDDAMLGVLVEAALNSSYTMAKDTDDGVDCLWPVQALSYDGFDLLVMARGRVGGMGHSEPARLSAYILRPDPSRPGLEGPGFVTAIPDFADVGTYGNPGELSAVRFGGRDGLAVRSVAVYQGFSFTDLNLFLIENDRISAAEPLRIGAGNGGAAEDEKDIVAVEGRYDLDKPPPAA